MSQLNDLLTKADQTQQSLLSSSKEERFAIYQQQILSNEQGDSALVWERILSLAKTEELVITEELLQQLYAFFAKAPTSYRSIERIDQKSGYHSPSPEDLPHIMHHLADQYFSSKTTLHPIELSAMMYKRILDIQPFMEEEINEQIALLILNVILLHYGYAPVLLFHTQKELTEKTLMESRIHYDMEPFCILIANELLQSMEQTIKQLSNSVH